MEKYYIKKIIIIIIFILFLPGLLNCIKSDHQIKLFIVNGKIIFQNTQIELEFDNKMYCKVFYRSGKNRFSINNSAQGEELSIPSHYIRINGQDVKDFDVDFYNLGFADIKEKFGKGKQIALKGTTVSPEGIKIKKVLTVKLSNEYPNAAIASVIYINLDSTKELKIEKVFSETYRLNSSLAGEALSSYDFRLLCGGADSTGTNRIAKLDENFLLENYREVNCSEFTTITPVIDLWNKTMGMAVGHIETTSKPVNLQVEVQSDNNVMIGAVLEPENCFVPPGGEYQTIKTMLLVHNGNSYDNLNFYSALMQK